MSVETAFSCYKTDCMFFSSCFLNNLHRKEHIPKYKTKFFYRGCFTILWKLAISAKQEKKGKLFL